MRAFLVSLLAVLAVPFAMAQVAVTGSVLEADGNEPVAGASVIVKGADGKIKKFASSKADGGFAMSVPTVAGCRLEVSMMSFARKSIPLDSVSFPLTVYLEPGTIQLKEVAVKADRIREQGDTITYNVGTFSREDDRTMAMFCAECRASTWHRTERYNIRERTSTSSISKARIFSVAATA